MANDYYDKDGMEAVDYIETVLAYLEGTGCFSCASEAWHIGNALKYTLRANEKPGVDWREDCRKCADYLCRAKTGRFMVERIREGSNEGVCTD